MSKQQHTGETEVVWQPDDFLEAAAQVTAHMGLVGEAVV